MKKKITTILNALLVAALTAASALPAFAVEGDGEGSITIKAAGEQSLEGKTFTAYEMFSLTYLNTGEGDTNSDDDYAYDLLSEYEDLFTDTLGLTIPAGETVDSVAYDYVSDCTPEELNLFTKAAYDYSMEKNITGITGQIAADNKSYRINGLENGYYLVFETVTEEGGTLSKGILSTIVAEVDSAEVTDTGARNVVVTQKADIPTLEKEIYHNELGTWGDVGDNQIGDTVYYRIHTTIPDTSGYQTYQYIIHDYMEEGLTFNADSVKIYTDEARTEEVTDGWTMTTNKQDGCDFEIDVARETLDRLYAEGERELYVYFDCILNEKAEIASEHNDNTAHLEYTNNPYIESTGTSQPDTVYDYTFVLDATKVNADGSTLADAEFQLMRDGAVIGLLKDSANTYYVKGTIDDEDAAGMTATDTIVTNTDGKIIVKGLDDAVEYTLRETKAPAGYVKADDIVFTLTAAYNETTSLLERLSDDSEDIQIVSYQASATILDEAQPPLPVTGGMGTYVFYLAALVTGGASVACMAYARKKQRER